MDFPEFDENGDLPVGIYKATLQEAVALNEKNFVEGWQTKRDETKRGIVEIIGYD